MNPYRPPIAEVHDLQSRTGVSHWLAIPVGFLLSALGVFVIEPVLVDLIIQRVLALPAPSRQTPMLALDLLLNTATLVLAFSFVAWWSRRPRIRAFTVVALLILGVLAVLSVSEDSELPHWYEAASYASVVVAWWVSRLVSLRHMRPHDASGRNA